MLSKEIIELRHLLHRYPELSCQEEKTRETLIHFLRLHTDLRIVPCEGWFYAVYQSEAPEKRPPIAFRADMDALPMEEGLALPYASRHRGVAHKCGHDGHAAALAGFGCQLSTLRPDRDVYLIFQHGEEIGAGGEVCSQLIREKGIGEVYACHNWSGFALGQILVRAGTAQCASQGLLIRLQGRPSHASQPEDGVNPCSALAELALWVQAQTGDRSESNRVSPVLATIVGMNAGGRNFGMSASSGELAVTLRAEKQAELEGFRKRTMERAAELASAHSLLVSFEELDVFPETACEEVSVEKVRRAARSLGLDCQTLKRPFRASEDFGYYLRQCPGAIFYVGNGTEYPEIHTGEYDFPDANLEIIIKMFSALCAE